MSRPDRQPCKALAIVPVHHCITVMATVTRKERRRFLPPRKRRRVSTPYFFMMIRVGGYLDSPAFPEVSVWTDTHDPGAI